MALELDTKDKKILEQLDLNSRQSNNQIAKKVRISKDVVGYRINNLEKQKIILGYYSVLNIAKLGYMTYKIMLTFQNTTSKIEKEIIGYLKNNKNVGWLVSCEGYYNLMIVIWVKNVFIFENFFVGFLKKYSRYIKERDILLITENHSCRKAYLFDKKVDDSPDVYYNGEQECRIDEKELKIIKFIANNSRIPLYKIAESLSLTGEAIAHRIRQLQKKNVIQAFRPIINTSFLKYQYYNVLFKLKKINNLKKMFDFFKKQPNITYFVKYLGSYDIGVDLEVKSPDELIKIFEQIKELFSEDIESYIPVLVYQEHKLSYFPE